MVIGARMGDMKLKTKNGMLFVETRIYQAGNGAVFLDWANSVIKLSRDHSDRVAYDIPDFDVEKWNEYYNKKTEQFACPSYVEGGKVIDCLCGKCNV